MSLRRAIAASFLIFAAGASLSCTEGHGKYTSAFKTEAQERINAIKSATEWDAANQAFASGELKLAKEHIDRSLSLKDDVLKTHLLHARILIEMGDADGALAAIDAGLEIGESSDLYYYRGIQLERLGDAHGAQASYARASEIDPSDIHFLMAGAETLVEMGEPMRARALLESRLDRFGYSAGLHQSLGHIALLLDDLDEASTHFREAAVLDPESTSIDEDLARISIATGHFAEAEFTLARLLRHKSHKGRRDLRHMHARTLIELDRPVEARTILRALTRDERGESDHAADRKSVV